MIFCVLLTELQIDISMYQNVRGCFKLASHTLNILLIYNSSQGFGWHSTGTVNPIVTWKWEADSYYPVIRHVVYEW